MMKINVFTWLLSMDRLNTRDMLDRRHCAKEDDVTCVLCSGGIRETRLHHFFTYPFSLECWQYLGLNWNSNLNFFQMVALSRIRFGMKGFLVILEMA